MKKWPWYVYGIIITTFEYSGLRDLMTNDSSLRMYYTILMAFDIRYGALFALNTINLFINLLTPLVVLMYAFDIQRSLHFWRIFFFLRIFFDLAGNNYSMQLIKSAFYQDFNYGLASVGVFVFPILPSYIAHYLYCFKKNKILNH
jgi:hypothetical protein